MALKSTEITQTVVFQTCVTCSMPIAMSEAQRRQYDESGLVITCVLGHQTVRRESDNQQLRRELREAQDATARAETARRAAEATLDSEIKKRRRQERRASNGVCVHCHRTFQQLARHMKSKHPDNVPLPLGIS